jgi:hypothetical protein
MLSLKNARQYHYALRFRVPAGPTARNAASLKAKKAADPEMTASK